MKLKLLLIIVFIISLSTFVSAHNYISTSYWKMEDLTDSSDNNYTVKGTYTGFVEGKVNNAIDLEHSSSQYVKNLSSFNLANTRTFDVWVKPESLSANQFIFTFYDDGASRVNICQNGATTKITFEIPSGTVLSSTTDLEVGVWMHIVLVLDCNGEKLYINGNLEDSSATVVSFPAGTNQIYIGSRNDGMYSWDGLIDNAFFTASNYSQADVAWSYNSGSGRDLVADTTPTITQNTYNMTSDGGCINWRTNKLNPCNTTDPTPTVKFDTNEDAVCKIWNKTANFTQMPTTNDSFSTTHSLTLPIAYKLVDGLQNIFISCEDASGNQNATDISTSGALAIRYSEPYTSFHIRGYNYNNNSLLANFSAVYFNSTNISQTKWSNGNSYIELNVTGSGIYTVTVTASDYFSQVGNFTIIDDTTTDASLYLYQSILTFRAYEKISDIAIDEFNISIFGSETYHNSTTNGSFSFWLNAGNYNYISNSTNYFNTIISSTSISALETKTINLTFYALNFTFYAFDDVGSVYLNNFSINIDSMDYVYSETKNDTNSDASVSFGLINGTYNISIDKFMYVNNFTVLNINTSWSNYTFNLTRANSIHFEIYDEHSNILMDGTDIRILIESDTAQYDRNTSSGLLDVYELPTNTYTIRASSLPEYPVRNYYVSISGDESTSLNIWLLNTTYSNSVVFYVRDTSNILLNGVTLTATRFINASYVPVEQEETDYSGVATFTLDSSAQYKFLASASGYNTKQFLLTPISTPYTIYLSKTGEGAFIPITEKISYYITPKNLLIDNKTKIVNFTFSTYSEGGWLQYFGMETSINGTYYATNLSGSPAGGTVFLTLNLTNHTGEIPIKYYYDLTDSCLLSFNLSYMLYNFLGVGNYSIFQFFNTTGALGDYLDTPEWSNWKPIIASISAVILVIIFAPYLGGAMVGIVGLGWLGVMTFLGYVPAWLMSFIAIIGLLMIYLTGMKQGGI